MRHTEAGSRAPPFRDTNTGASSEEPCPPRGRSSSSSRHVADDNSTVRDLPPLPNTASWPASFSRACRQAGGIEQAQEHAVAGGRLQRQEPLYVGLGQDALGERVAAGRQAHGAADVERQIAQSVGEGAQGLDRGEATGAGAGSL